MQTLFWVVVALIGLTALAYVGASLLIWTGAIVIALVFLTIFAEISWIVLLLFWVLAIAILVPLHIDQFRKQYITSRILKLYRKLQPKMSDTEQQALDSGTIDWDGQLFSGNPDWNKLLAYPKPKLTEEEQAFLDGPVEELCKMIDNWDITHVRADLPPKMWDFLKSNGFFSLIIPKAYGGKEFSALAHSAILVKVAGRSSSVSSTITVPNSLGPAELLLHYGTKEQKDYYLPRLARGEEIPCFALTAPDAGSDAGAMTDTGIVTKAVVDGKEVVGIRLNWNKRYITLAPVATVLGLAFKLYDPEHLMGEKTDIGITCALIPTKTTGVVIGRRHLPLNIVFQNGPTQGKDVFIPLDYIIGGKEMAGKGWRMLVECLSAGRGISLPSSATGGAKTALAATTAYARIRHQFRIPIGQFEGVQEVLARMAGNVYIMDATRLFTIELIDVGQKPAVLTAITKYHLTELTRKVGNDAMDIHGGKGICLGPKNYLGREYQGIPISITVEGANILTRSMIIFGQGAIRCHPYVLQEMRAAAGTDETVALNEFDKAIFSHIAFIMRNKARALILGLTGSLIATAPNTSTRRYFQHLSRFSAAFAYLTDMTMMVLGGELKFREKISARLGDVLSLLYMGSAILKHFNDEGSPEEDLPLVDWAMQTTLFQIQQTLNEILRNFPNKLVGIAARMTIFPLGQWFAKPSDRLEKKIIELLLKPSAARTRLINGIYLTADLENRIGLMEKTLEKVIALAPLEKKLAKAIKEGKVQGYNLQQQIQDAMTSGILTQEEGEHYLSVEKERQDIISVDDFKPDDLIHKKG